MKDELLDLETSDGLWEDIAWKAKIHVDSDNVTSKL